MYHLLSKNRAENSGKEKIEAGRDADVPLTDQGIKLNNSGKEEIEEEVLILQTIE